MTTRRTAIQPQEPAQGNGFDDDALKAIHSVLHDQPQQGGEGDTASIYDDQDDHTSAQTKRAAKRKSDDVQRPKNKLLESTLGHKHALKAVVLVGTLLLLYARPWLILGMLFFTVLLCVGLFIVLGSDRFWRRAMSWGRIYAKYRPERAVRLHRRLDAFAMKWDAILDRFPEGTVDALYLPDFGEIAQADRRHVEAMDRRLSQMNNAQG